MKKGISVVICSYNSENRIERVLGCLMEQENTDNIDWEVILVDNASTDKVIDVAKKCWKHPQVPMHIYSELKQGQSYATRTGIEKSNYDIVVLVDDDNYVCKNYISIAFHIMEKHPEVGIAGGRGEGVFDEDPPDWFEEFEEAYAIGPQAEQEGYVPDTRGYLYGAGSILRKPVYDYLMSSDFSQMLKGRLGKSLVAGEDFERSQAFRMLGYKLWYDPSLTFGHHMPASRINWKYLRRLFESFGRASNYHYIYGYLLDPPRGIRAFIADNLLPDAANKLRKLIVATGKYWIVCITGNSEGRTEVTNYDYMRGRFLETFSNRKRIKNYKRKLIEAEWRKKQLYTPN